MAKNNSDVTTSNQKDTSNKDVKNELPVLKLKAKHKGNSMMFTNPRSGDRVTKDSKWFEKYPNTAVYVFHQEKCFDNSREDFETIIRHFDKVNGLDKQDGYKIRELKLQLVSDEEKYG